MAAPVITIGFTTMPNPNDFILNSGYASFKNEIGDVDLSVTLPAGQTIAASGTFETTDTSVLGSVGSAIYARISPSEPTYETPSSTVDYSGKYFAGPSLRVYWPFEDESGNTVLATLVAFVYRPSGSQVRMVLGSANPNPFESITNTGGSITFTANVQTYLSPFEE